MDNLTHSLFGLTLARTPLGRSRPGATVALVLASNAPDIDIVTTAGGAARYLEWHRGPTHGLLGIIGLGLLTAAIVSFGRFRDDGATAPWSFAHLWAVSSLGVLGHILMDLATPYGTRPLSPFAWTWFAEDWMPIVDIYLITILGASLWFGRSSRPRNAAIAFVLMLALYGVRAAAHGEAIRRAPDVFGAQLPAPCGGGNASVSPIASWPRTDTSRPGQATSRCLVEVAAMPDPLSPFRWRLIAELSNAYEVRTVDLLSARRAPRSDLRIVATRYPNQWTPTVLAAARSEAARVFLGFSRFPAARAVLSADGNVDVSWMDIRFIGDVLPGARQRAAGMFGATVLVGPDGAILRERLGS